MMLPELMMNNPLAYLPVGSTMEEQFDIVGYLDKINLTPLINDSGSYEQKGFDIELNKLVKNKYFKVKLLNREDDDTNLRSVIGIITGEILEENETTITIVYEGINSKRKRMALIKILKYLGDEIIKVDILGDNSREKYIIDLKTFESYNDVINIGDIPKNGFELRYNGELLEISRYLSMGKITMKDALLMIKVLYREYIESIKKENDIITKLKLT